MDPTLRTGRQINVGAIATEGLVIYIWRSKQSIVVALGGPNTPGRYVALALSDGPPRRQPTAGQR